MNPLNHLRNKMIDFEIYRNSQLISTSEGLKNSYEGKRFIEFFPEVDVKIGDVLKNSNIDYYVVDVDTQTWQGEVSAIKAYYQTTPIVEHQANNTIYNIGNASNSIIGNQQSAIINNPNFSISDFDNLIETCGGNNKKELYQLSSQLQELLEKDDFHKSKLSKFSDLIAKHSWLPTAIAQIISAYLQSH